MTGRRSLWLVASTVATMSMAAPLASAAAGTTALGKPVAQILREAESSGIRVIFTDQSVPPDLRASVGTRSPDTVTGLREVLRPHGLALEEITGNVYVVARASTPPTEPVESAEPLRQIEVSASRYKLDSLSGESSFEMRNVDIKSQPTLFNDATRSIRRFPGTAGQDLSSRTFVRGGTPDDNLFLLDGVPLYEPFHLLGLPVNFSAIDPAVISGLDFYSGVLPIEYNGRMGGLVNLHLPEAPATAGGRISVGALDASALTAGPLPEDNGDWLMFARRSFLGRFVNVTDTNLGRPQLVDGLGRVRYRFDDGDVLTVGALAVQDRVEVADGGIRISDSSQRRYGWAVYERSGERVESRTTLSHSSIKQIRSGQLDEVFESLGGLTDGTSFRSTTLRQTWTMPFAGGSWRWGGALGRDSARLSRERTREFQQDVAAFYKVKPKDSSALSATPSASTAEMFSGASRTFGQRTTLDAGLSWNGLLYSTHQSALTWDPRLSLRFDVSRATRLRLSWGRMSQPSNAAELPVEQSRVRFDDPSVSQMRVIALEHDFGSWLSFRAEAFEKRISHPRPRVENEFYPYAFLAELRPDERVLAPDSARMNGFDLYATARFSKHLNGWLTYSNSRADDIFDGARVARAWDQPYSGGFGLAMNSRSWLLSAEVLAHSNWPLTAFAGEIVQASPSQPVTIVTVPGAPYSMRSGGFFLTLNLKAAVSFPVGAGSLRVALDVNNATDRTNWCCNDVVFFRHQNQLVDETPNRKRWPAFTPYASIAWEFGGVAQR